MQQLEPELQPFTEKGDIHFSEGITPLGMTGGKSPLRTNMADVPPVITGALLQAASLGFLPALTGRSLSIHAFTLIGLISVMIFSVPGV